MALISALYCSNWAVISASLKFATMFLIILSGNLSNCPTLGSDLWSLLAVFNISWSKS